MTNVEQATPTAPAKGRGTMPNKPKSTFNPLKADKALTNDDDAIVQAYRNAVTTLQQANPDLAGKPFTLEDDQILVVVRSVPGPSTDELEGKRLNELLRATGVEHKVSAATVTAEHEAEAAKDAEDFPSSAIDTLRKLTDANEFSKIGALVLRQNFLDDPKRGKDWLRGFRRIGAREGVKGDDGMLHNFCEFYKGDPTPDKNGVPRTKFHSYVADLWNKTDDGKRQQEQIELFQHAVSDKAFGAETFPHADDKVLADNLAKWRMRNKTSVDAMRQAIRVEQIIADLEKSAPNVIVQIKYKTNAQGDMTTELQNSNRPIIMANRDNLTGTSELSIRDFVRLKVHKAIESVPEAKKELGPNVTQLKTTLERKTTPNKGQGKKALSGEAAAVAAITNSRSIVNVHTMRDILTVTLPNFFSEGKTVNEKREYQKRVADLKSLFSPKDAEGDVLTTGKMLRELNTSFFGQFSTRFNALVSQEIDQMEKEAEAELLKRQQNAS